MIFQSSSTLAPIDVPRIETPRLILRAYRLEDLAPAAAMWADPSVTRHIGNQTRPMGQVWAGMQRNLGSWALLGYGYWAIEEKDGPAFIGECGFMEGLREIDPPIHGAPEAGWVLSKAVWGRGIATEAVGAMLAWTDAHLEIGMTVCIIEPSHTGSIRIAEKMGYRQRGRGQLAGDSVMILERSRGG